MHSTKACANDIKFKNNFLMAAPSNIARSGHAGPLCFNDRFHPDADLPQLVFRIRRWLRNLERNYPNGPAIVADRFSRRIQVRHSESSAESPEGYPAVLNHHHLVTHTFPFHSLVDEGPSEIALSVVLRFPEHLTAHLRPAAEDQLTAALISTDAPLCLLVALFVCGEFQTSKLRGGVSLAARARFNDRIGHVSLSHAKSTTFSLICQTSNYIVESY